MSRIGKKPVYLPAGVTVELSGTSVTVKGPKGTMTRVMHPTAKITQQDDEGRAYVDVQVTNPAEDGALWGTIRAHIANMVHGVSEGWMKALELNGVGFRMNLQGKKLVMTLGFSHEVVFQIPEGLEAVVEGNVLKLSGPDKELVGKIASEIRALKKPEPYKGKGFRYTDETIRRKAGKAAKSD